MDLGARIEELTERVARLEASRPSPPQRDTSLVQELLGALEGSGTDDPGRPAVVYAGAGPWEDGTVAWQIVRRWDEVRESSGEATARVLNALASRTRLRIMAFLLDGPASTGELAKGLDQPSSGQLFHHLKELMAAGVIHQPVRGTYAVSRDHAVPLLAVLSAAADLVRSPDVDPS